MGVPDFEGGWASQPSQWLPSGVRQASFALSLAHVINEMKRSTVCPLAVWEIWAYWDEGARTPKALKLAVFWGVRPQVGVKAIEVDPKMNPQQIEAALKESKEFWAVSSHERDEGILAWPFPSMETLLRAKNRRFSLLYRDTRVEPLDQIKTRSARFWRARRMTLREAGGEVSDLLRQIGAAISYAAMPMPSQRLTLWEIREAREGGMGIAIEAMLHCATHESVMDAELEYDFACRAAGEMAVEQTNAVLCMAWLQGFFMALGESDLWAKVAGGGEQEAFFGLLCRLEPKWGESLDAMARLRED
jgi:hypothetical protein